MNAARARRRWMAWCRYVDKTQTRTSSGSAWRSSDVHWGQVEAYWDARYARLTARQVEAYWDARYARRAAPHGIRVVYYPKWGHPRD